MAHRFRTHCFRMLHHIRDSRKEEKTLNIETAEHIYKLEDFLEDDISEAGKDWIHGEIAQIKREGVEEVA